MLDCTEGPTTNEPTFLSTFCFDMLLRPSIFRSISSKAGQIKGGPSTAWAPTGSAFHQRRTGSATTLIGHPQRLQRHQQVAKGPGFQWLSCKNKLGSHGKHKNPTAGIFECWCNLSMELLNFPCECCATMSACASDLRPSWGFGDWYKTYFCPSLGMAQNYQLTYSWLIDHQKKVIKYKMNILCKVP